MKTGIKITAGIMTLGLIAGVLLVLQRQPAAKAREVVEREEVGVLEVEAFGVVKAKEVQNIVLDFPAYIQKVLIREGQRVKMGDPLVQLDLTEYSAEMDSQRAQLRSRRKELQTRQAYLDGDSDPDVNRLYVELRNAETLFRQDLQQLAKRKELYEAGVISQNDYQTYEQLVESRKKAVDDAKLSIEGLQFNKSSERDRQADTVIGMSSNLTALRNRLDRPFLRGNMIVANVANGVVYDLNCTPGDRTGQTDQQVQKLFSILDRDSLLVVADVDEELMGDVVLGAEVSVALLADRSRTYRGKVTRIADRAIIKNNETYIQVEIALEGMDEAVKPEMNVDVKIKLKND